MKASAVEPFFASVVVIVVALSVITLVGIMVNADTAVKVTEACARIEEARAAQNRHEWPEYTGYCEPPLIPIQPFSMMIIDAPGDWLQEAHYWIHEEAFRQGVELPVALDSAEVK